MPSPEAIKKPRRKPLLTMLFWAGVGLAPIAALLLLVGDGNAVLRIAAVLAILTVVLIGLSIALRPSTDALRDELEELVFDEIDELREGLRKDIETAARATHKAFGEKLQVLYQSVEAGRGAPDPARLGRVEPATGAVTGPSRTGRRAAAPDPVPRQQVPAAAVRPAGSAPAAARQTAAGPPEPDTGNVYGSNVYGGRGQRHGADEDWSESPSRGRRPAGPDESSWTDQRAEDRQGATGPGRYGADEGSADEDGYWSSLRSDGHRTGGHRAAAEPSGPAGPRPPTWDGPDRDPLRSRHAGGDEAYGYPPLDDVPRAGGARRAEGGPVADRSQGSPDDPRWR
ncbi:hypothetical protein ACWDV4_05130 [Micromonospora sp. NPDC003197]